MPKSKILLIEDGKTIAGMVKRRMEMNGYEVAVAVDGLDGLDKVRDAKPDLILLDLELPKMDGFKVFEILKKDDRYARIPVIMFTTRAQYAEKKRGEEMGADAYITKPFKAEELLSKIKELLEKNA